MDQPVTMPVGRDIRLADFDPDHHEELDRGAADQATEVIQLDTEVLDVADEAAQQVVSVRFRGLVREEAGADPVAFDEVWHLVKPHGDGSNWLIAGIEQLDA